MAYSVQKAIKRALELKTQRYKTLAKGGAEVNPTFASEHPNWVTDANKQNPNYASLIAKVKEEHDKYQEKRQQRELKLGKRL
jgi:hypothetical protein